MLKALALASSLLLAQGAAQAAVTYHWVTDSYSSSINQLSGSITFDESIAPNGSLSTSYQHMDDFGGAFAIPGVTSFSLSVNGVAIQLPSLLGYTEVQLDLGLQGAAGMQGSASIFDSASTVFLGSTGTSWTISYFSSDNSAANCFLESCSGATGHWALAGSSSVPEPGTLALMLPALGAWAWKRRQRPQRDAALAA